MTQLLNILESDRLHRLNLIGEDTSDLLGAIQDGFGITLSTDDFVEATTVGKLAECISKKIELPVADRCLSAVVFYRMRRALVGILGVPHSGVAPTSQLRQFLPWHNRRRIWREIQTRSQLVLPDLRWPLWLVGLCLVTAIALGTIWPPLLHISSGEFYLPDVLSTFLFFVLLLHLLRPYARSLPRSCKTVGDLAILTLARNYAKIAAQCGASSQRELLTSLRHLIAAATASDIGRIRAKTRFPEDLDIY